MRAQEFVRESIHPDVVRDDFYAETTVDSKLGPLKLVAKSIKSQMIPQFRVDVYNEAGQDIGYARFVVHNYEEPRKDKQGFLSRLLSKPVEQPEPYLVVGSVSVDNEFRRHGIATAIYKFVHDMGNTIKPSSSETDKGQALWKGFADKQVALTELADKPYPFQIAQHGAEKSTFGFDTDNESEYIVKIVPFVVGQAFQNNALDVSFALMQDGRYVDTATGQAGQDALRVFGTVVEAVKQTIAKRTEQGLNIEYIQFKAVSKEPKRVALYQRFAKNIGRYIPGWEFWKNWYDDGISTSIVKKTK